jgi:opacity protein-like surface antigen
MKKLLMMAFALLFSGTMLAQGSKVNEDNKSFIAFHGGPSFPIGDFSSRNFNNSNAGFAKTGFNINLDYAYLFTKSIGVTASLFVNKYDINDADLNVKPAGSEGFIPVNLDHWQFYGITAGPVYSINVGKNIFTDIKVMGGVVNANAPIIKLQGQKLTKEEWKVAGIFQAGAGLKFGVGKNIFIVTNANYMHLNPTFKYTYTEVVAGQTAEEFHQKMDIISVTAGVGYNF